MSRSNLSMEDIRTLAFIVGIVIGAVMLLATSIVYLKKSELAKGGIVFTVFGAVLLGMSVWASVKVEITADGGVSVEVQKRITTLENTVSNSVATTKTRLTELNEKVVTVDTAFQKEIQKVQQVVGTVDQQHAALAHLTTRIDSELPAIRKDIVAVAQKADKNFSVSVKELAQLRMMTTKMAEKVQLTPPERRIFLQRRQPLEFQPIGPTR